MVKNYSKHLLALLLLLLLLFTSLAFFIWQRSQVQVLRIGLYAGSSWDVPNASNNRALERAIQAFEKAHPQVQVVYETGIPKDTYTDWLSDQIVQGQQPDAFLLPSQDFKLLARLGALEPLSGYIGDGELPYYPISLEAGHYREEQYALPLESNPILMCINKDLLQREGIALPEEGWTLEDFYRICQQVTRDTDGDGQVDQFGSVDYSWQEAFLAYGGQLTDGTDKRQVREKLKESMVFLSQLKALNGSYQVTARDFDEGKVAFYPMSLADYRTYKPYPYHVAKYSSFSWTCLALPVADETRAATPVDTSLLAISSLSSNKSLAYELIAFLTQDRSNQQTLFEQSQGLSVLPQVLQSERSADLFKEDDFGEDALDGQRLNQIMEKAVLPLSQDLSKDSLKELDYMIQTALNLDDIDGQLSQIMEVLEKESK